MTEPLRILLADDQDLVRDAVSALITRDSPGASIKSVGNLPAVIEELSVGSQYSVVVLDLRMPGMSGVEDAVELSKRFPSCPIVLMSGVATKHDVHCALRGGLGGFLPKTLPGRSLVSALLLIVSGERYFPVDSLSGSAGDEESARFGLSPRELEVLAQLRRGSANKEIARALGIEESTVKLHLRSMCAKLNAKNRTDIVIKTMAVGINE